MVAHLDPGAPLATDWQKWTIPLSDFQGMHLADVREMRIGIGDRANPKAGGTGLIYIDDIRFGHPLSPD